MAPTNGFVRTRVTTPYQNVPNCAPRLTPAQCLAEWQARVKRLTPRQLAVVQAIAAGLENKLVAGALGITIKTVEKHRQFAYRTLNVHNAATLTRVAVLCGIVPPYLQPTAQPKPKQMHKPQPTRKEPSHAQLSRPGA